MAYLPNLDQDVLDENDDNHVPEDVGPTTSEDFLKAEHKCLAIALKSLKAVHRKGGFATTVLGRKVKIRVWIHFICGDTHGNNRWVAHFNSPGKLAMPWRTCKCPYPDMNNPNPKCIFIRREDVARCIRASNLATTKAGQEAPMTAMSKHNVELAFHHHDVPLSDQTHGVYKMMPPDILHIIAEGISKYIFESLQKLIGNTKPGERAKAR